MERSGIGAADAQRSGAPFTAGPEPPHSAKNRTAPARINVTGPPKSPPCTPNCFRIGTDATGNAYIAVAGQEDHYLTDTREALRTLIHDIKAGKADHLL